MGYEEDIKKHILSGSDPGSTNQKHIILGDALKLKKDGPVFSIFSPCLSLPSVATDRDRKQFQCLNVVLHNKTGPLFLELN